MATPAHRIDRLQIELDVDDPELGATLIERVSQLHPRAIAPLLDRVCGELSGPGRIDRFDALELELGPIDVDDFDQAFVRALADALRRALSERLPSSRATSEAAATLELIETFAETGNLPWWADRTAADPVADALEQAIRATPGELVALLNELDELPLARVLRRCRAEALVGLGRARVGLGDARVGLGLPAQVEAAIERAQARVDGASAEQERVGAAEPTSASPGSPEPEEVFEGGDLDEAGASTAVDAAPMPGDARQAGNAAWDRKADRGRANAELHDDPENREFVNREF
ncbi:MAG TPA: contractile injection system tape measure protein, partial [Enhygromyxa sp.]|nr:contractile injection system tape measure protein [Enhygromyxa sp.]